jgi:HlyD family secretion protein
VAEVFVEEGANVTRGQPLARLDDTLLKAQIDQSRANLAQQQVAADRAEAEAARVAGLDNEGVLSQEAIAERRLAARSARAAVAVAEAQLRDLQTRQARMVIRAPVAGRVLERTERPGDTSSPGTVMFRMARDGLVELDAEVPETELGRVHVGDRADVEIASGVVVQGRVRLVSPRVDQQTKLGRARIALPVRADLRPGGFARATILQPGRTVPAAPEAAIRYDADGASAMVVGDDNRVRRVPVRTGARAGGWVELVEGPPPGSRVALGGSAFVLEGDRVKVVEQAPSQPARRS